MAITYKDAGTIKVYLDGKHIGDIRHMANGFRYFPKGANKIGGAPYPTLSQCKQSLEAE